MKQKTKYVRMTQEKFDKCIENTRIVAMSDGAAEEREKLAERRFELATKLINSIGQTQQQFADMLKPDGVIAKLLE